MFYLPNFLPCSNTAVENSVAILVDSLNDGEAPVLLQEQGTRELNRKWAITLGPSKPIIFLFVLKFFNYNFLCANINHLQHLQIQQDVTFLLDNKMFNFNVIRTKSISSEFPQKLNQSLFKYSLLSLQNIMFSVCKEFQFVQLHSNIGIKRPMLWK